MWKGNSKALGPAVVLALSALALAACGSGKGPGTVTAPAVSQQAVDRLARLSDRIATHLDAGETCSAAIAADDLQAAVQQADLPDNLRSAASEVASRLVDEVNCPPPPPPPEEKHTHGEGDQHGGQKGPKPPGHDGKLPPGQAKLKGESG